MILLICKWEYYYVKMSNRASGFWGVLPCLWILKCFLTPRDHCFHAGMHVRGSEGAYSVHHTLTDRWRQTSFLRQVLVRVVVCVWVTVMQKEWIFGGPKVVHTKSISISDFTQFQQWVPPRIRLILLTSEGGILVTYPETLLLPTHGT
jgi:hypothetical protein